MLKKIFPVGAGNSLLDSFKLIVVAEGYLASGEAAFASDTLDLVERLLRISPFNLSRKHRNWLSVYTAFQPSASSGPAIDAAASPGRTVFDTSYSSAERRLSLSQAKVNAYVAAETVLFHSQERPLAEVLAKGSRSCGTSGALVALLSPPIAGHPQGGEGEILPLTEDDFHSIALSRDGRYEQVVARSIACCLGLGDEFELPDADKLAPATPEEQRQILSFNLQYFDAGPPAAIDGRSRWYELFSTVARSSPPSLHPKANPASPDTSLADPPATPEGIEFWEGGGGYRTKVWRSAHDCLMRRRLGDPTFPLREGEVPFCLACRHFLRNVIW